MFDSAKKVALITGASSGIGYELAKEYLLKGFAVLISARNETKLKSACANLKNNGSKVEYFVADCGNEGQAKSLVDFCISTFGKIDVVICNAGITMRGLIKNTELSVIHQVMQTNFWGAVYVTKFALPYIEKSSGSIVAISSVAGFIGLPTRSGYVASKFAMEGFFESLRLENRNTGVHVLIVRPGFTSTEIRSRMLDEKGTAQGASHIEEKKSLSAEKVAKQIFKAQSARKPYLMQGSEAFFSFYIKKWFPRLADRLLYSFIKKEKGSGLR